MKNLLVLFILIVGLVIGSLGYAATITADTPVNKPESCEFQFTPAATLACVILSDGTIFVDATLLAPNTYSLKARNCVQNGLWCTEWSAPLIFTRPVQDGVVNTRVVK